MAGKNKSWSVIEADYIRHKTSYRKLAKKYGINERTIARYGKEHNWVLKRQQFVNKMSVKVAEKISDKESDKLAHLCEAADSMVEMIKSTLSDPKQFNRKVVSRGDGTIEEVEIQTANVAAMKQMTSALKDLAAVMRDVYNIPREEKKPENVEVEFTLPKGCDGFDV